MTEAEAIANKMCPSPFADAIAARAAASRNLNALALSTGLSRKEIEEIVQWVKRADSLAIRHKHEEQTP